MTELETRVLEYQSAKLLLEEEKKRKFPRQGIPVFVDAKKCIGCRPSYTGYGIAIPQHGEPPEVLTVLLENGNSWWYPVEVCEVVPWSRVDQNTRRQWLFRKLKRFVRVVPYCTPKLP